MELEDYRVKKHWVVFEVDLNGNTPMKMVAKAAQKHNKLPPNMHYRSIWVWDLGVDSAVHTFFVNDGTGSSSSETPPQRAPATSSKGYLIGKTRLKLSLISCALFLDDGVSVWIHFEFGMKKTKQKAAEELKKDRMKNIRAVLCRWLTKSAELIILIELIATWGRK